MSPWTDLALTGASLRRNAAADPMLDVAELPGVARSYLAGADPCHPWASPIYGDLAGLPPALIQVGGDEILYDDAARLAARLDRAGGRARLEIWPRMPHVWHLFAPVLPEARRADRPYRRLFARAAVGYRTGPSGGIRAKTGPSISAPRCWSKGSTAAIARPMPPIPPTPSRGRPVSRSKRNAIGPGGRG